VQGGLQCSQADGLSPPAIRWLRAQIQTETTDRGVRPCSSRRHQDAGGLRKVVADAISALGGLDILINNAACQQSRKDIGEITDEQVVRTFETSIFALFA